MKDFKSYIVDAYAIPREIVISDGSPTDIRAWCDTVDDFELFYQETGMELRYDGLISKERSGDGRLMLCSAFNGAWVWNEVLLSSSSNPLTIDKLPDIDPGDNDFLLVQGSENKVMGKTTVGHMRQVLSTVLKFEPEQEDGDHIVLETNAQGEAYGRMPWRIVE